jgi:hypothetical protein
MKGNAMKKRKQRPKENPLAGELVPPIERQYYTVAFLVSMLQKPPEFIHRLMRAAQVEFAWAENGIGVIRGDDVVKMKHVAADVHDAVADAHAKCEAAPNN